MNRLAVVAKIALPLLALAAVALALWMPEAEHRRPQPPEQDAAAVPESPPVLRPQPPAPAPSQVPLAPRPAADFPQGVPWQAGTLTGTAWLPVQPHTAWLVVAPAPGEDASAAVPMLRNLWASRDIAAVLLAAPPTPAAVDRAQDRQSADQTWGAVLDALTQQRPGSMAVLVGSATTGEAALRWAADPRVLAVAALDAGADLPFQQDPAWRSAAMKKHLWIGGSAARAQDADRLTRGLPYARAVARGTGNGLQWLAILDQRAALSGWLISALGQ